MPHTPPAPGINLPGMYSQMDPASKGRLNNSIYGAVAPGSNINAQDPYSSVQGDTVSMSPETWLSTNDRGFQEKNPAYAAMHKYYSPFQSDRSIGYMAGGGLHNMLNSIAPSIGGVLNKGPMTAGLASAVPGLLLGVLGGGVGNLISGGNLGDNMGRNALLGALMTGGLGAYSGYLRQNPQQYTAPQKYTPQPVTPGYMHDAHNNEREQVINSLSKQAYMLGGSADSQGAVVQAISSSPTLSYQERSQLIDGVSHLGTYDLEQLATLVRSVGGAAVGAIVARFLLNRGLIGTVLGALMGSSIARSVFGPTLPTNDLGQPSLQGRTSTGELL